MPPAVPGERRDAITLADAERVKRVRDALGRAATFP